MTIKFSSDGPEIPSALLDALIAGDVVFVCGAGVSMPQLPGFGDLVVRTYDRLRVQMDASETQSFAAKRFEEVLGSLGRRLVDPDAVVRVVSSTLQVPDNPALDRHATVLRLSRDIANKVVVVTTNFDTLIERALADLTAGDVRDESAAGQGLPPPGGADFHGVIHMHGRLRDDVLNLDPTPLVLTSADYGDAYMRSGWASRFLFDLVRCKTVVLIGYGASDAPVRYFLSVLAADRARFPSLSPVYAFDGVQDDAGEANARWGALAVTPLPYRVRKTPGSDAQDHGALWDDLKELADVVEAPKSARRARAAAFLVRKPTDLTPVETAELDWLFRGRDDLWDLVIREVRDEAWFDHFQSRTLWASTDAAWVIAAWIGLDPQSRAKIETAIRWMPRLRAPFADRLRQRIRQSATLPVLWLTTWRLICLDPPADETIWDDGAFDFNQAVSRGVLLDRDLERAVGWLTPRLVMEVHGGGVYDDGPPEEPLRIHDICWPRLRLESDNALPELFEHLPGLGRDERLIQLATAALAATLETARDADLIQEEYDAVEAALPSVEAHRQNDHHDGVVHLVGLIALLLPNLSAADPGAARRFAEGWKALPGRLGLRLWLHATRQPGLFEPDEILTALAALSDLDFWTLRRELNLALRDSLVQADRVGVDALEERILTTAGAYYERYPLEDGQPDWRKDAQDSEVWLRLNMLDQAGLLSARGAEELAAIRARRDYLDRPVEDRDFFGTYSTGVQWTSGDPAPILEASDEDRLRVALEVRESRDFTKQFGWSSYARQDPEGAFRTVDAAERVEANAPLWRDFIGTISFGEDTDDTLRKQLGLSVFEALQDAAPAFIGQVADRLVDLLWTQMAVPRLDVGAWWDRLWTSIAQTPASLPPKLQDLHSQAINSAAGRLTQVAMKTIENRRDATGIIPANWLDRIRRAGIEPGEAGLMARAILAHDLAFLNAVAPEVAIQTIKPAMEASDDAATALRKVAVENTVVTPSLTLNFGPILVRGAVESEATGWSQVHVASKILIPVASVISGEKAPEVWGVTEQQAADALRDGNPALRAGAIEWFHRALEDQDDPAAAWRTWMSGMFLAVWPLERRFRDESLSRHFAELAIKAGEAFPEALIELQAHIVPSSYGRGGLLALKTSDLPERFPRACLSLLWRLFGMSDVVDSHDLPNILDRLETAEPALASDRRFQWLEHRVVRYG